MNDNKKPTKKKKEIPSVNRLEQLRVENGYSIKDISEKFNVQETAVIRWEKGMQLSVERLVEFCKLYKTTCSYILNLTNIKGMNTKECIDLKLHELRKERGLSRPNLAEQTNFHTNSILFWEQDKTAIRIKAVLALAEFFEVSIDYFLGLTDYPTWELAYSQIIKTELGLNEFLPVWITSNDINNIHGYWGLYNKRDKSIFTPNNNETEDEFLIMTVDVSKIEFVK